MESPSLTKSAQFKYHVYLSFNGTDTRSTIVAHLHQRLKDKGMSVFLSDVNNKRGNEIHNATIRAREESEIFVVIFSVKYLFYIPCLDELAEIMMLREARNGLLIIPVFYRLGLWNIQDPVAGVFECGIDENKVQKRRDALNLASQLYGWTTDGSDEATVIEEIVTHIWKPSVAPPCSTIPTQFKYDVFMSFIAKDTRSTFVSHLYRAFKTQGIRVYTDPDRSHLKLGLTIEEAIFRAMEESKIFLIIFSENYASSRWCLDELVKIMKFRETNQCLVIPVFYGIDPSHIAGQTGPVKDAFLNHMKDGVDRDKLQSWRDTLRQASTLRGWDSTSIRDDVRLIQDIIEDIWNKLGKPSQSSSVETGGSSVESGVVNSQIDEIMSLLRMNSSDVRIIGILGEGGIGKTTIVKELFRQIWDKFQRFYFLTNVKEEVKRSSVDHLLKKLCLGSIDDESPNSKASSLGLAFKMDQIHHLKVLLILDDVDDPADIQELVIDQIKLFGAGSRILITSRINFVIQNLDEIYKVYKVQKMNDQDSKQLFKSFVLKRSYNLTEILKQTDGNPLAIKVLGSSLREKNDSEWDQALEKLEKFPVTVHNVLRYGYDTLTEEEKKVFLDVACFFVGENWDDVVRILDEHYSSILIILSTLVDRSLISNSNMKLEMHDLLQDMAWTIVREEVSTEPGKRSKLWDPKNLYQLLSKQKGWMMLGCSSSLCLLSL